MHRPLSDEGSGAVPLMGMKATVALTPCVIPAERRPCALRDCVGISRRGRETFRDCLEISGREGEKFERRLRHREGGTKGWLGRKGKEGIAC